MGESITIDPWAPCPICDRKISMVAPWLPYLDKRGLIQALSALDQPTNGPEPILRARLRDFVGAPAQEDGKAKAAQA